MARSKQTAKKKGKKQDKEEKEEEQEDASKKWENRQREMLVPKHPVQPADETRPMAPSLTDLCCRAIVLPLYIRKLKARRKVAKALRNVHRKGIPKEDKDEDKDSGDEEGGSDQKEQMRQEKEGRKSEVALYQRVRARLLGGDEQKRSTSGGSGGGGGGGRGGVGWELSNWVCDILLGRMRISRAARPTILPIALSTHLQEVDLSGGILEKTNECVWLICLSCPNLEVLNLARSPNLIDVALKPLAKHLLKLHHLDISECLRLTSKCLVHLREIKSLTSLRMRNMKRLFAKDHRETALEGLSNAQMPQLKELDISAISYSKKCGDSLLQFLASNSFESFTCLNLELHNIVLDWSKLRSVRVRGELTKLPSDLPDQLQRIEGTVSKTNFKVIAQCCPSLTGMRLYQHHKKDEAIDEPLLSGFSRLERLHLDVRKHQILLANNYASLTKLNFCNNPPKDKVVRDIFLKCSKLRSLRLSDRRHGSVQHNDAFKDLGVIESLQKLKLSGPYGVNDVGISRIVQSFPNLKHLEMRNSYHRFTDYSLSLLADLFQLRVLDLSGFKDTSDKSLVFILRAFPNLREIDIAGWSKLGSEKAFERFERGCTKRQINLRTPWNANWRQSGWQIFAMMGEDDLADSGIEFYSQ